MNTQRRRLVCLSRFDEKNKQKRGALEVGKGSHGESRIHILTSAGRLELGSFHQKQYLKSWSVPLVGALSLDVVGTTHHPTVDSFHKSEIRLCSLVCRNLYSSCQFTRDGEE